MPDGNQVNLAAEMRVAREALTRDHAIELVTRYGIDEALIRDYLMIGFQRVRIDGDRYQPDPAGDVSFVSPVLVHDPVTPESHAPLSYARILGWLIDIVAWDPRFPDQWATRLGIAEWLGCIPPQHLAPAPVRVRRSPVTWLRAGCHGLVPLSPEPADVYRLLAGLGGIVADDPAHAAELRRALQHPWRLPNISTAGRRVRDAA